MTEYVQGINYIASLILHIYGDTEETIMIILVITYFARDILSEGFKSLKELFYVMERAMMNQMPKLYNQFKVT